MLGELREPFMEWTVIHRVLQACILEMCVCVDDTWHDNGAGEMPHAAVRVELCQFFNRTNVYYLFSLDCHSTAVQRPRRYR